MPVRIATSVSIIVLPTKWIALAGDALAQQVVARLGRVDEQQVGRPRRSRSRLISSGIVRSKLRSPASTWATGMPSFDATSAAASVELTSPGDEHDVRLALERARARAAPSRAPSARRASPSRRRAGGRARRRRAPRGRLATSRRRSAARCGRARARTRPAARASAATIGAIFMKFGRVPTTDSTLSGVTSSRAVRGGRRRPRARAARPRRAGGAAPRGPRRPQPRRRDRRAATTIGGAESKTWSAPTSTHRGDAHMATVGASARPTGQRLRPMRRPGSASAGGAMMIVRIRNAHATPIAPQ